MGEFSGVIVKLLTTGVFWVVAIFLLLLASIGSLWLRKKRKLQYPALIHYETGGGKGGWINSKAGWFKSKSFLFGLWDYGAEEYLKVKDGRKVLGASTDDFHEINGRKGIVCYQKEDDNTILTPVKYTEMTPESKRLIMEIAPKEYREYSSSILDETAKETKNKMEQIIQWIIFGGVIIFALISIILITQMVQRGQKEAADLIIEAGKIVAGAAGRGNAP